MLGPAPPTDPFGDCGLGSLTSDEAAVLLSISFPCLVQPRLLAQPLPALAYGLVVGVSREMLVGFQHELCGGGDHRW